MILSLLSVATVFGCLVCPDTEAKKLLPAPPTLKYVLATFRHGPRSPLYRHYPSHENTELHLKTFDGLRGVLTRYGKQKMYDIGKKLGDRYRQFLGEYREDRVWVTSRGASRNVMTCLTIMAGMLPPQKPIFADINWQPIPAFATKEDKSHMFHDLEFKKLDECPKYKVIAEKFHDEVLAKVDWERPIYRLLRAYTENHQINNILGAYQVYDSMHSEALNGINVPSWAEKNQPGLGDLPIYPTLLRRVVEEWMEDDAAKGLLNLYIGPYFNMIKNKLRSRATDEFFDELMHFHVTEDMTLMALLKLLQIKEPNAWEPGNGFIIELHRDTSWFVKFYIYDSRELIHDFYEVMPAFVKTQTCSLATVLGVTLAPTWEESCGLIK